MSQFPIDVDAEAIFFDGTWYTRDDLSRRIRAMLDAGDFNVARPSMALQELTQLMQNVRTLAFRSTPELADALTELAGRMQQSVGAVIREAVTQYLTQSRTVAHEAPRAALQPAEEAKVQPPAPSAPTATATSSSRDELPKVIVASHVIAGPGALKAAGVEPIELTQAKAVSTSDSESSEQRWFKQ
jgi:predicted transcriptional regulator